MLIEYGLIEEEPGMEEVYSIIPEDLKMNPKCPCTTRTCPNHGFCKYCVEHHRAITVRLTAMGMKSDPPFCNRFE